jgi:chromosome partitioning protein
MCKVYSLANQKGGVGKSITTANLGIGLARQGKKVLVVDCDPQNSLTVSLGIKKPDALPMTLAGVMGKIIGEQTIDPLDGIIHHPEGIDLMPANISLAGIEINLATAMCRETILRQYMEFVKPLYDCVLLDCTPSLGMLTINALAASDYVIVPVVAQYLPVKGLELLLGTIARVQKAINPNLAIGGILLTMVDSRTNFTREIVALVENAYGGKINIFKSSIPFSVRAAESGAAGTSIYLHDPRGKVAAAYKYFTGEVLDIA